MYLTQPIGNILQKFNNQNINIFYEPYHNMIDIMFKRGFNIDEPGYRNSTLLHRAIQVKSFPTMEYLIGRI